MLRTTLTAAAMLIALAFVSGSAEAGGGWESPITVASGVADNRLSLGGMPGGTAGRDGAYDVPALLGGDVQAYFVLDGESYWRDIKGPDGGLWVLRVESAPAGERVTLSWDRASIPAWMAATLTDTASTAKVDMRTASKYTYVQQGSREFIIEVGK